MHVIMQVAMMLQQVGDGSVEVTTVKLRAHHLLRIVDVTVAGNGAYKLKEELLRIVKMRENDVGGYQGTGIDKRIARLSVLIFQLHKRIKSRTGRLLAYSCPQVLAQNAQSHGKGEHLCYTLYGELNVRLAETIGSAVKHTETYSKLVGVDISQCRNIIRLLAVLGIYLNLLPYFFQ